MKVTILISNVVLWFVFQCDVAQKKHFADMALGGSWRLLGGSWRLLASNQAVKVTILISNVVLCLVFQ